MNKKANNVILSALASKIGQAIEKAFPGQSLPFEDIYFAISEPPQREMGHFAFACFPLAKTFRMGPQQISQKLAEHFEADENFIESLAHGPYLNISTSTTYLAQNVVGPINNGTYFQHELFHKAPKTMVEYSQPNTHKVLHVGHMRNLCLGNSLINILRYAQVPTIAVTYPGDVGTHVAKCLWYLKNINKEPVPDKEKGAWLGELYTKANTLLEDEKGTDKEEKNREQLTAILKQLKNKSGEYYDLWVETRSWSIDLMKKAYDWANVTFDKWFYESEVDAPSLQLAHDLYDKGILVKDDGAIGMDLSDDKLGFCILIKSDGTGLYSTKDVELARRKFEEDGIEHNIYVVDNRQSFHFQQVFKVLEKMGFEQAKDCFHLQYDVVELPDGAMSSRKGNIVPLMDLIRNMENTIKENYLNKYAGEWDQEEIDTTARQVAGGAIKYGMIRVDNNRKIVFDMNEWLKLDGETGPYLQYVCARISSLVKKSGSINHDLIDYNLLTHKSELELLLKLNQFNSVAAMCADQLKTMPMCSYLYELGKMYNSFYAECPINSAESEQLKFTRLALSQSVSLLMRKGLSLLGIEAPKHM